MTTLQGGILNTKTTTAQKIPPLLRDDDVRGRLNHKIAFYRTMDDTKVKCKALPK